MLKCIRVLLAVAGAYLALAAPAHAETVWRTWGSCPFADKREVALGHLDDALRHTDWPEEVKNRFRARLAGSSLEKGADRTIKKGDRFPVMMSCGAKPMTDVLVGEYLDPQGVTHKGHTLSAEEWTEDYQGKRYTLTRPDTCNNLAFSVSDTPPKQEALKEPDCYELRVPTHTGDRATFRIDSGNQPLPPYGCRTYKTAGGMEAAWPTCFECFPADGEIVIYVDRKIADRYNVHICWEHEGKPSRKLVITPQAWKRNGKFVQVPPLETIGEIKRGAKVPADDLVG